MSSLRFIFVVLLFTVIKTHAQNSISGYVNINNPHAWKSEVYLSKINLEDHTHPGNSELLGSSPIDKDGYFSFGTEYIDRQNQLYKVHLEPIPKNDRKKHPQTSKNYKLFILSKEDSIFFEKGNNLFGQGITNSAAHREWKQFQKHQSRFESLNSIADTEEYLMQTRGYVKDSLHILLVKLIGIKKLDDKELLEKDIKANTSYYLDFLEELKSSDLNPTLFLFLENKVLTITGKVTERKYMTSYMINLVALVLLLILGFLWYKTYKKHKKPMLVPLSNQESIIKDLIISGKTNKEIADTLYISHSTVKTHISNIYSKLHISNRKELLQRSD